METARIFKRRALLYVPGSSEKMLAKSMGIRVDGVVYDLEDAVAPGSKADARRMVADLLKKLRGAATGAEKEILVRVNPFDSPYAVDDFLAVCAFPPHSVILPKATVRLTAAADAVLGALETKHGLPPDGIGLIPLVETAEGVETAGDIAAAARRVTALQFGAEDFTRDMGIARTAGSEEIRYARNRVAIACRAYRIDCLDTPYIDFKDTAGCESDTEYAKSIGMTGRCVIHPSLIEMTQRIFSPSREEVEYAEKVIAAYEDAVRENKGAVALDGKMIDFPVVERARDTIRKAAATRATQ